MKNLFFLFIKSKRMTGLCVNRLIERDFLAGVLAMVVRIVQAGSSLIQYEYERISSTR